MPVGYGTSIGGMKEVSPTGRTGLLNNQMIAGLSRPVPIGLSFLGFEELEDGKQSDPIGFDITKATANWSCRIHLARCCGPDRVKNDRHPLGSFLERYCENSHAVLEATRNWDGDVRLAPPHLRCVGVPLEGEGDRRRQDQDGHDRRDCAGAPSSG